KPAHRPVLRERPPLDCAGELGRLVLFRVLKPESQRIHTRSEQMPRERDLQDSMFKSPRVPDCHSPPSQLDEDFTAMTKARKALGKDLRGKQGDGRGCSPRNVLLPKIELLGASCAGLSLEN
ncbi:uncharacterized protein PgNI_02751, partial [Pyricularia grisea]|uniref:Uncharacterized protein n=1 Tax=Pyricularia grisea TaxID=148305 RepID=A0A6P8BCT7_PYRGI